ncbi:hypothetical protein [Ensifer sp. SSB1]|jgi:hypothetical protein|uniref:hypothetical protein n=1 Tax=Ensifer sp. SSB1 TaxID=2795385 RepID=UPI001A4EF9E2|nr:hypothetical protein [Ensifer sp. SSB1]MBK5571775.1 hypothetical protein [Ensifer sp. SSB1]
MSAFSEYVTGTAFNLSLSRRQIECLCQIDQYGGAWVSLNTFGALVSKGLCERVPGEELAQYPRVQMTEAGRAVIPLLKLAGVYIKYPEMPAPAELPEIEVKPKFRAGPLVTLKEPT